MLSGAAAGPAGARPPAAQAHVRARPLWLAGWLAGSLVRPPAAPAHRPDLPSLSASLSLEQETLAWLADPANVEQMGPGMLPPGLEAADPLPFLGTALLVGALALAPQLAHEAGHAVVASMRGIKTAPS